jgi:fructose PTS system EIIBC or EIIC component
MRITDYLTDTFVSAALHGKTKTEIIDEILRLIKESERITDFEKVRKAVFEREQIMSTGVGNGFAIPHGKTDGVTDIVAGFGITERPIEYDALDNKPVRLVFLLIGRDNMVGSHIKLLSRVSRLMNNEEFRNKLLTLRTSAEIIKAFRDEEAIHFVG